MGYKVQWVADDHIDLEITLDQIAEQGAEIVSIMWQPERDAVIDGAPQYKPPGYTVVSRSGD